jgi:cytidine deaminase
MDISDSDKELIEIATGLVKPIKVPGGITGEVGCALRTKSGNLYTGVCLHLVCGLGTCGEYVALASAVTQEGAVEIDTMVSVSKVGVVPPCGRCRELVKDVALNGADALVVISNDDKVKISELLPHAWSPSQSLSTHLETQ